MDYLEAKERGIRFEMAIDKLQDRIAEFEAELADICKRLRGIPGPDGSRLDGENGLAAAVMRAHDEYKAGYEMLDAELKWRDEEKQLTTLRKAVGEAVGEIKDYAYHRGLGPTGLCPPDRLWKIAIRLEAAMTKSQHTAVGNERTPGP